MPYRDEDESDMQGDPKVAEAVVARVTVTTPWELDDESRSKTSEGKESVLVILREYFPASSHTLEQATSQVLSGFDVLKQPAGEAQRLLPFLQAVMFESNDEECVGQALFCLGGMLRQYYSSSEFLDSLSVNIVPQLTFRLMNRKETRVEVRRTCAHVAAALIRELNDGTIKVPLKDRAIECLRGWTDEDDQVLSACFFVVGSYVNSFPEMAPAGPPLREEPFAELAFDILNAKSASVCNGASMFLDVLFSTRLVDADLLSTTGVLDIVSDWFANPERLTTPIGGFNMAIGLLRNIISASDAHREKVVEHPRLLSNMMDSKPTDEYMAISWFEIISEIVLALSTTVNPDLKVEVCFKKHSILPALLVGCVVGYGNEERDCKRVLGSLIARISLRWCVQDLQLHPRPAFRDHIARNPFSTRNVASMLDPLNNDLLWLILAMGAPDKVCKDDGTIEDLCVGAGKTPQFYERLRCLRVITLLVGVSSLPKYSVERQRRTWLPLELWGRMWQDFYFCG